MLQSLVWSHFWAAFLGSDNPATGLSALTEPLSNHLREFFAQHRGVTQKVFLPLKASERCPVLNSLTAYQFSFSKCGFRWQLKPKDPGVSWTLSLYTSGKVVPMHTEGPCWDWAGWELSAAGRWLGVNLYSVGLLSVP